MSRWLPTGASMGCRRGLSSSGSSSWMTPTGGGWTPTVVRITGWGTRCKAQKQRNRVMHVTRQTVCDWCHATL